MGLVHDGEKGIRRRAGKIPELRRIPGRENQRPGMPLPARRRSRFRGRSPDGHRLLPAIGRIPGFRPGASAGVLSGGRPVLRRRGLRHRRRILPAGRGLLRRLPPGHRLPVRPRRGRHGKRGIRTGRLHAGKNFGLSGFQGPDAAVLLQFRAGPAGTKGLRRRVRFL